MDANQVPLQTVTWERWALVGLALMALALRLPPMLVNRFHPDEALYGYWALLIALGRDPGLVGVPVYKPPLLPYLIAVTQGLLGKSEFAVRLPGLAAGMLTVPLAAALTHALYRDRRAALTAAAVMALSPFAILFSATAFTDLPMVALGIGAGLAAARGRPDRAGLLVGLAFAAKRTGLAWLPLVMLFSLSGGASLSLKRSALQVGRLLLAFGGIAALVFGWDAMRVALGAESFWHLGVTGYGGLRFIWPREVWSRLADWLALARYLFVSPIVGGALLVGLPVLGCRALTRSRRTRCAFVDLCLIAFLAAYVILHWLWAFPIWDRYLLPLLPVLAILLGRLVTLFARWIGRLRFPGGPDLPFALCSLAILIALARPAYQAAAYSRYPVGGDHGAYDGIERVADFLNQRPEGTVVYHHWLGWPYAYYLFDGPISLAYWPTSAWLAQDVTAFGEQAPPRYIAFPAWESSQRVAGALSEVGYTLQPVLTTFRRDGQPSFFVYRIRPLSGDV